MKRDETHSTSKAPDDKKPYAPPRLKLEGHMADVTRKSGPNYDNSPAWPSKRN